MTAPKSASLLAGCFLARPTVAGCAWCGAALPPRRRTWCSDRCATTFWTNHWWTLARSAAKRRDKYRCRACGAAAPKRPTKAAFVTVPAYRTAMRAWRGAKKTQRMEVNHRIPCRGKHGTLSCDHHLDNLETLCTACHRVLTQTDRRENIARSALAGVPADPEAGVGALPVGAVGVGAVGVGAVGVGAVPVGAVGVGAEPVGAVGVGAEPVGAVGVGAVGVGAVAVGVATAGAVAVGVAAVGVAAASDDFRD